MSGVDDWARDVIRSNQSAIVTYFSYRVENAEDAADLFGETALVAWRQRHKVPASGEEARRWLYGVASNILLNNRRSARRRGKLIQALRDELTRMDRVSVAESSDDSQLHVREAIAALPSEQAELLKLVHWDRLTIADAAVVLGLNASTVRSRYSAAKAAVEASLSIEITPDK